MSNNSLRWLILIALGLTLAACGGREEPTATTTPANAGAGQSAATTVAVAPTNTPEKAAEPTTPPTEEIETLTALGDLSTTLSQFSSYRWEMVFKYVGESGVEKSGTYSIVTNVDPPARQMSISSPEADPTTGELSTLVMTQIGNQAYMITPEGCISIASDMFDPEEFTSGFTSPDQWLGGLDNARRIRPNETINGVEARHYRFDDLTFNLPEANISGASGDLYVADDGDYVTRYTFSYSVAEGFFSSEDGPGVVTYEFNLLDVNAPVDIQAPEGCEGADSEFPMLDDAASTMSMPGIITYSTAYSVEEAVSFYKETLAAEGWTYDEGASMTTGEFNILAFTREGVTLNVNISADQDSGQTTVMLLKNEP